MREFDSPGCCSSRRCSTTSPRAAAATIRSWARSDVRRFCRQHGIDGEDSRAGRVAGRAPPGDVADGAEAGHHRSRGDLRRSPSVVGNERRLTALYLLTVADIRGTSPKVWNAWKGKLLEDLFRATRACWAAGRPTPSRLDAREPRRARTAAVGRLDRRTTSSFWATLDIGYFLRHEPADIAWHTRHVSASRARRR